MAPTRRTTRVAGLTAPIAYLLLSACGQAGQGSSAPTQAAPVSPAPTATAAVDSPVVVELYQSQGCSSCPPANANLNAISDRRDVLALSFAVTYWDRLGWKDSFARPEFTERQWDYANAADRSNVATPQVVINGGRTTIVGHDRNQLDLAIAAAGAPRGGPRITLGEGSVELAAGRGQAATVWLVRYDPQSREVAVGSGENGGRTLPHRGIVRELVRLGEWNGTPARFDIPRAEQAGLSGAILVQAGKGGAITAARRV